MNSEFAPKIIVASGMAVVVAIIAVTFALRSHHSTSVAQISQPPAAVAQIPDAPAPVAPTPNAPAAVAPMIPDAPAPVARDNASAKIGDTVEPKVTGNRHPARARISDDTTDRTVAPEPTVDSRKKSAAKTLAKSVDGVKSFDELRMPSAPSRTATDAQEGTTSNEPTGSDSESPPS